MYWTHKADVLEDFLNDSISYSTVLLYIGIIKVLEILAWNCHPKPAWYLLYEYWLGIAKPKNVFRSILNPSFK